MFPYRLSTASDVNGKKSGGRGPGRDCDGAALLLPFADGGPLQAAIRADLDQLFPQFTALLAKGGGGGGGGAEISAFVAFKTVFKKNKVALLHLFAPPRCDVAAYSQLLYAICWSMIRDAHIDYQPMSPAFFEHVAYATFLLYTLYQTNPLSTVPQDPSSYTAQLELLPFGLFDSRNPKELTFARHFVTPIRIDYEHYGYLLRVLDVGQAATDHRQVSLSLVQDLLAVVHRLLSQDMLEFCAFTGPCSLEGLAGHEIFDPDDCPISAVVPTTHSTVATPFTLSSAVEEQLHQYQSRLGNVRMPPVVANMSNRAKRIRSALEPVFSDDATFSRLLQMEKGGPIENRTTTAKSRVTFGPVTVQQLEDTSHFPTANGGDLDDNVPAILLPEGLSAAHAESIRLAVRTLVDRSIPLLPTKRRRQQYHDDASQGFASSASAFASHDDDAIGNQALGDLINRSRTADYGTSFLASQTFMNDEESEEDVIENLPDTLGGMSDLSSDGELFDEVSTAVSRVGQSALQELLKRATGEKKKRESKRSSSDSHPPTTRKRRRAPRNKFSDDGSQATEVCVGRKSLDDLLSKVRGSKVSGDTKQHRRTAPQKRGTDKRRSTLARPFPETASVTTQSTHQSDGRSNLSTAGHNALRKLINQARSAPTNHDSQEQRVLKVPVVRKLRQCDSFQSSAQSIGSESRQSELGQSAICNLLRQARYPTGEPFLKGNGSSASSFMDIDGLQESGQHGCTNSAVAEEDDSSLASKSMNSTGHASWQSNVGQNALGGLLQRARVPEDALAGTTNDQTAPE
jgi:Small nuclear RNA activating complex (SNAPc), subunit 1